MRGVQSGSGVCVGFKLVVFLLDRCVAFVMSVRRVSGCLPSVQDLFVDVFVLPVVPLFVVGLWFLFVESPTQKKIVARWTVVAFPKALYRINACLNICLASAVAF